MVPAWRQHQQQMRDLAEEIALGRSVEQVIGFVVPGGGKSVLPVIAASILIPAIFQRLCWIVPRDNLRQQAEEQFLDRVWRQILGHRLRLRPSRGIEKSPARGQDGYITTYQSVQEAPSVHVDEFETVPYGLVLDEPHHCELDGTWYRAVDPLVRRASFVLLMTGVVDRGDHQMIGWLPYARTTVGNYDVMLDSSPARPVITYTRRDALSEDAIIDLELWDGDARGEWVGRDGKRHTIEEFADAGDLEREAVELSLDEKYAYHLLAVGADAWRGSLRGRPHNQLLVVAHRQARADQYATWLRREYRCPVGIATTDEGREAARAIKAFRNRELPILVTVGMAYEGMDAPGISHLVALTHIRSRPWIEQMVSRAARVDPLLRLPPTEQLGMIYAPRDPLMLRIMSEITEQQHAAAQDRTSGDGPGGGGTPRGVIVLDSELIAMSSRSLFRHARSDEERRKIVSERIERATARADFHRRWPNGTVNRQIVERFGKHRPDMTIDELAKVWAWLNITYPEFC